MRRWWRRGALAVVGWAALVGFAIASDRSYSAIGLAPVALAVLAVWWFSLDTLDRTLAADWRPYRHQPPARTFDPRFTRLCQDVGEIMDRPAATEDLRRSLRVVADSLLRDDHGVSPGDTERRRQLLGDEVAGFLGAPPPRDDAARQAFLPLLAATLDRLETL